MDNETAQELIRQLITDRQAYLEQAKQTHELLHQVLASTTKNHVTNSLTKDALLRVAEPSVKLRTVLETSTYSDADTSETDDSELWYVQQPLAKDEYGEEGLKDHLFSYDWDEFSLDILQDLGNRRTAQDLFRRQSDTIFPTELHNSPDRSHLTEYSIFDVVADGSFRAIASAPDGTPLSKSLEIWNRLKSTNAVSDSDEKAVGRVIVVREPSPLLFAALHYALKKHFDMDQIFEILVDVDPELSRPPNAFADDIRHQRSFTIAFEYYTLIGKDCEPMAWQKSDVAQERAHIPISRCSSIVALSFEGDAMGMIKNKHRRAAKQYGTIYDPFSPYRVLNIQCCPDLRSSLDIHDKSRRYVNGPEAFLVTLCGEYHDAAKRLTEVYKAITTHVEPPQDFLFSLTTRDRLLFEDSNFTYSRRYFWAYHTLGIINEDIEDMIVSYQETFKSSVWDGSDRIIWPVNADDMDSPRQDGWRKRMAELRKDIEKEIASLKDIRKMNIERMKMIKGLHISLVNGTSVHEARKSVEGGFIAIQQGNNIRLLSLVTIFFLPLTFVTSIFGMTAIPLDNAMNHYAYTTIAICLPTYILIGSLSTDSNWWKTQITRLLWLSSPLIQILARALILIGYQPKWTKKLLDASGKDTAPRLHNVTDPIWLQPEIDRRRRRMSQEKISRTSFNLTPANTMIFGERKASTRTVDRSSLPSPRFGDKDLASPGDGQKPLRLKTFGTPKKKIQAGEPPPHRPSIGIVPGMGQILPPAFPEASSAASLSQTPSRTPTVTFQTEMFSIAEEDSSDGESTLEDRKGILHRLRHGSKSKRDDTP